MAGLFAEPVPQGNEQHHHDDRDDSDAGGGPEKIFRVPPRVARAAGAEGAEHGERVDWWLVRGRYRAGFCVEHVAKVRELMTGPEAGEIQAQVRAELAKGRSVREVFAEYGVL